MKRILFSLAMAIAVVALALPARAVVINNGIISLTNRSDSHITVYLTDAINDDDQVRDRSNGPVWRGDTWHSINCCFAAGSSYRIRVRYKNKNYYHTFRPHLCNRNGIPYGYYHVVFGDENQFYVTDQTACYTGG